MTEEKKKVRDQIKRVCFTGHRDISPQSAVHVMFILKYLLRVMIENGSEVFLAGGALGFDTIAALSVLDLKKEFPHIRLELILPCKNQTKMWKELDKNIYNNILSNADRVEFLHETYTSTCMHDRNRRLIDEGDMCVAYLEHSGGGTAYTVSYALKQDKDIINIAEMI